MDRDGWARAMAVGAAVLMACGLGGWACEPGAERSGKDGAPADGAMDGSADPDGGGMDAGRDAASEGGVPPDGSTGGDGGTDAALVEGGAPDGAPEAGTDAGTPDASLPDASLPDASLPDASLPDASLPDASLPDATAPDAGSVEGKPCETHDDCLDDDLCTDASCNPFTNQCEVWTRWCECYDGVGCDPDVGCLGTPYQDGTTCSSGSGVCTDGRCGNDCFSGNEYCNDYDPCNGPERCDTRFGWCFYGPPPDCDDGNECTTDTCDGGCLHTPVTDGTPCDGGQGTCQEGACVPTGT